MEFHSPPREPPHDVLQPVIHEGTRDTTDVVVLPPDDDSDVGVPLITLFRKSDPHQAYSRTQKPTLPVSHGSSGIGFEGRVFFAFVLDRVPVETSGPIVFQAPSRQQARYVAIKQIDKIQLHQYLERGGRENPYKDIARMQQLGDDIHVLSCVEALQDDHYLYIITPMACEEGTLADYIHAQYPNTMATERARQLFRQVLDILSYLLDAAGISHRDVSPDNLLFLDPDNLVAFDLALSTRNPYDETGRRLLTTRQGTFGTLPFMAPEIFCNRIHDGAATDLWSAGVLLYGMVTGRLLYRQPHPCDLHFRFFVLGQALGEAPLLREETIEILRDAPLHIARELQDQCDQLCSIDGDVRRLLRRMLIVAPWDRWTLQQVMESDFVRGLHPVP